MLQDALSGFEAEIQSVERTIALFQLVHHPERLKVMLEPAERPHALVQGILTRMSERRVPQVVRQRDGLDQVLVDLQAAGGRACDLRNFQRVRQAGPEQVAFMVDEYLRLVLQAPERGAVNDAIAVALKLRAGGRLGLGKAPAS